MVAYLNREIYFRPDESAGLERALTGVVLPYKMQGKAPKRHLLAVVTVPREARSGSIYHLRIAQNVEGQITGGYTVAIKVR